MNPPTKKHESINIEPFSKEKEQFIKSVADQIGLFISRVHNDQERILTAKRSSALLALTTQAPTMTDEELLIFALEQAEALTGSQLAYAHFVNDDQETITLGIWSKNTLKSCNSLQENYYLHSNTEIWADCFQKKQSVIHNDYQALTSSRGLPSRHPELLRHLSVPVMNADKIAMIFGIGNKVNHYDEGDLIILEMIANNTWALIQRNRSQRQLELHAEVFRSSREAVIITDSKFNIASVNNAFTSITGYLPSEVIGQTPKLLQSGKHDPEFYQMMWQQIHEHGHWHGEIWNRRKNGEIYPELLSISKISSKSSKLTEYIGIFMDISEFKHAQERIEYLAHHDPLTDLCNRTLLPDRFQQAKAYAHRQGAMVGLIYLDLDHFKNVNDSLGHPIGDKLLVEVAHRLRESVREIDTVSRIGGDEFVILVNEIRSYENIAEISRKILEKLSIPFNVDNIQLNVTCSIGACLYPNDGEDFDTLMKKADTVLYQAKSLGRNTYQFFTEKMNHSVMRRISLESEMRQGLSLNQFFLHYQPQFDITTGQLVGVEALLRWQHPTLGEVSPNEFIPVAEDCGFIVELGHFVMRTACAQASQWLKQGYILHVAVNVSYVQFMRNNLLELVNDSLQKSGLHPKYLEIELTESILVADTKKVLHVVQLLQAQGVRFSIDDFGTGYSSLSYLKRFAVNKWRIQLRSAIANNRILRKAN